MSDMARKAARAAVERSGSCRDTTYFDGPTKCRWQSHSAHDAEPYYSESINTAHDLLTVRDRAVGIPGSVPQSLITDHTSLITIPLACRPLLPSFRRTLSYAFTEHGALQVANCSHLCAS